MERIRKLRAERGLTQVRLAVAADMNPATLNRIEMGKANPNLKTLERLAAALGVSVPTLLEADYPKAQPPLPLDQATAGALLTRIINAAHEDEAKVRQAINRVYASQGQAQNLANFAEDRVRSELLAAGFPDEHFEGFLWPLVLGYMKTASLEAENARLRGAAKAEERAPA